LDAILSIGQIQGSHTISVDSVDGYIGSKSAVEMKGFVCAISSRTIRLDSREELLE
jgi:hypothetical protein